MKNMILITAILILLPGCRDGLQVVVTDKQGGDTPDKEVWVTTDENGVITDEYATIYNNCLEGEEYCPFIIKTSDGNTYTSFESYDLSDFTSEKGKVKLTYRPTEQEIERCHFTSGASGPTVIIDIISIELNNDGWSPTMIEPIPIMGPYSRRRGYQYKIASISSKMVIRNLSGWRLLLDDMNSGPGGDIIPETDIDFSKYMVIAVFFGYPGAPNTMEIQSFIENKDDITVAMCYNYYIMAVIGYPFYIAKIPITKKPIIFEDIIEFWHW